VYVAVTLPFADAVEAAPKGGAMQDTEVALMNTAGERKVPNKHAPPCAPVVGEKFSPNKRTRPPPLLGPEEGLTEKTIGVGTKVNRKEGELQGPPLGELPSPGEIPTERRSGK